MEADIPMSEKPEAVTPATPEPPKPDVKDIDASWDGKGSLDEHRKACFEKLKQPGFGRQGVKTNGK